MGHIGKTALKALPNAVIGLKEPVNLLSTKECETCLQAKSTAKVSRIPMPRAKEKLEKIHSDICGPITPQTYSKKEYFISFIDDKTRWAVVKLLHTRDQIYDTFNEFSIEEENQLNAKIKRLHSDNAKEYKSERLDSLCKSKGVIAIYTAPYTPV